MPSSSSSPNHLDLSDPTTIYHLSQTSKTDTRNPRHAALAEAFPDQFSGKNVATKSPTSTSPSQQTTPTKSTKKSSSPETKTPRHAQLSEYFPEAYFGTDAKRKEAAAKMDKEQTRQTTRPRSSSTCSSEIDIFENLVHGYLSHPPEPTKSTTSTITTDKEIKPHLRQRKSSVSSTATTATSSSIDSTASTLATSKPVDSKSNCNSTHSQDKRKSSEIDIFDYQSAGYLSMPINHPAQPYNNSRKSSSSSSSATSTITTTPTTSSLWKRAKGKLSKKNSGAVSPSETEKEERRKDYVELGLEEKTKFGTKGGMNMVG